jgi:hypothetical protein
MPSCHREGVRESVASAWLRLMKSVWGVPPIEKTRLALVSVETSLRQIQLAEDKIKQDLSALALQARAQPREQKVSPQVQALLRRSRTKRQQMTLLHKKHMLLETQRDALQASDLNQLVFSTMQNTSQALKSMGLEKTLEDVDEVMQDIGDSSADVRAIQEGLSADVLYGDLSDSDLLEELGMLLDDAPQPQMCPPQQRNRMTVVPEEGTEAAEAAAEAAGAAGAAGAAAEAADAEAADAEAADAEAADAEAASANTHTRGSPPPETQTAVPVGGAVEMLVRAS